MHLIQVYYHDGETYYMTEESKGLALSNAEGISTHEIVEHVDVIETVHVERAGQSARVQALTRQYIDGYELPEES